MKANLPELNEEKLEDIINRMAWKRVRIIFIDRIVKNSS